MKPLLPMIVLLAAAGPGRAVEPVDTFSVRLGGYITNFDTKLRADGETERGTRIDLHRDLGLDNSNTIGFAGVTWRPFDKHEFGLAYYRDSADADRNIDRDFEFDGNHYLAQTRVRSKFDLDAYEPYYVYWAWKRDNWVLGPRFGLIWYSMTLELKANVDINGNPSSAERTSSVDADLPAPTIGGSWRWTPANTDAWRISADAGYFSANVDNVDADVTFGRAGVEYFPWERWGFSLDYTVRRISADVEDNSFDGDLRFIDSGLRLGVTYRF